MFDKVHLIINELWKFYQNSILPWFLVIYFSIRGERSMVAMLLVPKYKYSENMED